MKFSKLFDKLYVPYIQMYQPEQERKMGESFYFVDDLSQAHYINTYPSHLHSNIIQFTKFMLGKMSAKLSSDEIKELYAVSGFQLF
jgi:redox-sensitive bicupin YhaK (pirin superfamily)